MVVVLNARTGFCEAVMLDNAYLTDLRTGLAGAVAARHLAPETVRTVGVLGSGAQARYQIRALRLVRDFERVLVSARDAGRTAAYVAEMSESLALPVEAATPEALVRESDVVITTTRPGACAHRRRGLAASGIAHHRDGRGSARKAGAGPGGAPPRGFAWSVIGRSSAARWGSCSTPQNFWTVTVAPAELGEVTSGRAPGRQSPEEITVCDLTGTGVQDTANRLSRPCPRTQSGLRHPHRQLIPPMGDSLPERVARVPRRR